MKNVIVSSTIILFVLLSNCASSSDREFPKSFGIDVSHHNGNINWGKSLMWSSSISKLLKVLLM